MCGFALEPEFVVGSEIGKGVVGCRVLGREGAAEEDVLFVGEAVFGAEGGDLGVEIVSGDAD